MLLCLFCDTKGGLGCRLTRDKVGPRSASWMSGTSWSLAAVPVPGLHRRAHGDSWLSRGTHACVRLPAQHGANFGSPAPNAAWLGVSPPTRTTGAANPLVQDFNWRSDAYRCAAPATHGAAGSVDLSFDLWIQ